MCDTKLLHISVTIACLVISNKTVSTYIYCSFFGLNYGPVYARDSIYADINILNVKT